MFDIKDLKTETLTQWDEIAKAQQGNFVLNRPMPLAWFDKYARWKMILAYLRGTLEDNLELRTKDPSVKCWGVPHAAEITEAMTCYLHTNYPELDAKDVKVKEQTVKSDLFRMGAWVRAFKALKKLTKQDVSAACTLWALYCFGFGESAEAIDKVIKEACQFDGFGAVVQLSKLKGRVIESDGSEGTKLYRLHEGYQEFLEVHGEESQGVTFEKGDTDVYFRQEYMRLHIEGNVFPQEIIHFKFASSIQEACRNYHKEHAADIRNSFDYAYCHEQKAYVERYKRYFVLRSGTMGSLESHDLYLLEVISFVVEGFFWYDEFTNRGILAPILDNLRQHNLHEAKFFDTLICLIENYPPKELEVRKVGRRSEQWKKTYHALSDLKAIVDKAATTNGRDSLNKNLAQAFLSNYLAESLHFQIGQSNTTGCLITGEVITQAYQEALTAVDTLGDKFQWIRAFFLVDVIQFHLYNSSFLNALKYCLQAYESVQAYNKNEPEIRSWIFNLLGDTYYAMKFFPEASNAWAVARYHALRFQHDQQAQSNAVDSPPPDSYTVSFLRRTLNSHITIARKHYHSSASPEQQAQALAWLFDIRSLLTDAPIEHGRVATALGQKGGPGSSLNKLIIPAHVQQSNPNLMQYAAQQTTTCKGTMIPLQNQLVKNLTNLVAMCG